MASDFLKLGQKDYPQRLAGIKKPPENLFYEGDLDLSIFDRCLGVVGTRSMTDYGKEVADKFVRPVAQAGITIVSGFMYGIDAAAHRACLDVGGKTIAVLGCGIDIIRPKRHVDLKKQIIASGGLIVSELPGDHPAFRWTFVKRNRIISGLSQAVLVVEAPKKSGALITADFAFDQSRDVLAVPGPVTSSVTEGTSELIKKGATLISKPDDILSALGINTESINKDSNIKKTNLSLAEKEVVANLEKQNMSVDRLSRELEKPAGEIGRAISMLSLKGLVGQNSQGEYYLV
jgi:DNA processing protein